METIPGMLDANVEIFAHEGKAYAIYNGSTIPFKKLPTEIFDKFFNEFLEQKEVVKALFKNKATSISEKFNQYLVCRYGALDRTPDLDVSTEKFTPEFYECGKHSNCPYEYIICQCVPIKTDTVQVILSKRQIEIIQHVANGIPDKTIAEQMHISIDTVITHKKHIYEKLGIHSNTMLTAIAFRNNLIQ